MRFGSEGILAVHEQGGEGGVMALTGSRQVKAGSSLGVFTRLKWQYSVEFAGMEGRVMLVDCLNRRQMIGEGRTWCL